jgi:GntR family transcriptional repressor for pyruvate dehydrogenase complex
MSTNPESTSKRTKAASLADDLVRQFEDQIQDGSLTPGSRFPTEKAVTESFGVSRTVVREAFARLAARGLLVSRRGSGAYVAPSAQYGAFQVTANELEQLDDVLKLLEMRRGFEAEMAEFAAARRSEDDLAALRDALAAMEASADFDDSVAADSAFHGAIAVATRNEYFVRFTKFLGVRLIPSRRLLLPVDDPAGHRAYARMINEDHQNIYDRIAAGDAVGARAAAGLHMSKSYGRHLMLKGEHSQP